jgi:D-arabinose 1-dehydrogenase-like Zn-dependent alcohol dehydrogenase
VLPENYRRGLVFLLREADERSMTKTMRAVQVPKAKGAFELVEREIPNPQSGWVRVKVQSCGICHSDSLVKDGLWPGIQYPRVPGHEVIGIVDAIGENVRGWKVGQRVGVGWHGGNCGYCRRCRRGEFVACEVSLLVTGISFDGGYAEYMTAPAEALASVPDDLSAIDSAPLMCAGITTFNALRNSGARGGDIVGVLGVGGLGHLGVQFAAKMGFVTVAIARGKDKEPLARKLGATHYIDSQSQNPAAELAKLGGAKVVIATVTNADAMSAVIGGLAPNGVLMVIGAAGPMTIDPILLISGSRSVKGWYSGTAADSEDTLKFSASAGVQSMNEIFPLERAAEAYDRMMSGKARFRVVLNMESKG